MAVQFRARDGTVSTAWNAEIEITDRDALVAHCQSLFPDYVIPCYSVKVTERAARARQGHWTHAVSIVGLCADIG